MSSPMFIVVGPSASGKSTFVNRLVQDLGLRRAVTSTTRQPRPGEGPDAYHFLTPGEFQKVKMVESINYAGNKYGTSCVEADISSLAILEPVGAQLLQNYCRQTGRPCYIIGLSVTRKQQAERMVKRGDLTNAIEARLSTDKKAFAHMAAICDTVIPNNEFDIAYAALKDFVARRVHD